MQNIFSVANYYCPVTYHHNDVMLDLIPPTAITHLTFYIPRKATQHSVVEIRNASLMRANSMVSNQGCTSICEVEGYVICICHILKWISLMLNIMNIICIFFILYYL